MFKRILVTFVLGGAMLAAGAAGAQTISGLITVTPCRMIDTRKDTAQGYPPPYGTPAFAAGERRTFTVDGAIAASNPCAGVIPTGITALAVNLTAVGPTGAGDLREAPGNVVSPTPLTTSILNFSNVTIANATVVPVSTDEITLGMGAAGTGVLMDVYGYFQGPVLSSVTTDGITLSGNGTGASPLGIANGSVGPVQLSASGSGAGQVLTSSGSAVSWQNQTGLTSVTTDATLTGNGTGGTPLGISTPLSLSINSVFALITAGNTGPGPALSASSLFGAPTIYSLSGFASGFTPGNVSVWGDNSSGYGVIGTSAVSNGVGGFTDSGSAGVSGYNSGTNNNVAGVFGQQSTLPAIYCNGCWNAAGMLGAGASMGAQFFGAGGGVLGHADVSGGAGFLEGVYGDTLDSANSNNRLAFGMLGAQLQGSDVGVWAVSRGFSGTPVFGRAALFAETDQQFAGIFHTNNTIGDAIWGRCVDAPGNNCIAGYFYGDSYGLDAECFGPGCTSITAPAGLTSPVPSKLSIPVASDPTTQISYSSLAGREAGVYFRGSGQLVNGFATISVPDDFKKMASSQNLTAVVTPVGDLAVLAVMSQDLNAVVIQGSKDVKFNYMVSGVRVGTEAFNPIQTNRDFKPRLPTDKMPNYPADVTAALISNGIYNADGSVNMTTAQKMGWAAQWAANEKKMAGPPEYPISGPWTGQAAPGGNK